MHDQLNWNPISCFKVSAQELGWNRRKYELLSNDLKKNIYIFFWTIQQKMEYYIQDSKIKCTGSIIIEKKSTQPDLRLYFNWVTFKMTKYLLYIITKKKVQWHKKSLPPN